MYRIFSTQENAETTNKNISLIVKAIEIIFLQYELEKLGVDSLLPTQFQRVTVPKREVCSWVSFHRFIYSGVIFQEHLRCSRFSVDNTEKLQLTLTLHSAPHHTKQSTTFCQSIYPHSCQSMSHSVQFSCSVVSDSATPWTTAHQASLSITNSWSLLKFMSVELVIPSNHLILCCPLLPLYHYHALVT